ncbi:hypothetical protein BN59_00398 [Legionella massiliensis]|uniref:Uncharacterized protein n=1 Tax=Legionella massiliensis TaxID=1034943 RepID=A0A078KT48_9GAMM|nr:hemerythrin domain-containing protein [Legionella massiliensis]CDZ76132.1 hypothetical protein BN59_00398 [Legionella massiliensis]CEE11870.1 hypothetical protein BN1094_00398 [Legionella massiliensis]
MKRESHLFACHKFLEEQGSQILICLAKVDFRNTSEIEILHKQLEDYLTTLANHARWEEEFIFNKFFTKDEVSSLFGEHSELESSGGKLIEALKELLNLSPQSRLYKGKLFYLEFRKFHAVNLIHFYDEETAFLSLLQERATDAEIRAIDKPIYQGMSDNDMVEMLELLLPPTNISEKKNILDDLRAFNANNFELALPKIQKILTSTEAAEILRV